jgi:hypothetical protein
VANEGQFEGLKKYFFERPMRFREMKKKSYQNADSSPLLLRGMGS